MAWQEDYQWQISIPHPKPPHQDDPNNNWKLYRKCKSEKNCLLLLQECQLETVYNSIQKKATMQTHKSKSYFIASLFPFTIQKDQMHKWKVFKLQLILTWYLHILLCYFFLLHKQQVFIWIENQQRITHKNQALEQLRWVPAPRWN